MKIDEHKWDEEWDGELAALQERSSDDDHFYGAWTQGRGGRAPAMSSAQQRSASGMTMQQRLEYEGKNFNAKANDEFWFSQKEKRTWADPESTIGYIDRLIAEAEERITRGEFTKTNQATVKRLKSWRKRIATPDPNWKPAYDPAEARKQAAKVLPQLYKKD